jgi:hypothetical protein
MSVFSASNQQPNVAHSQGRFQLNARDAGPAGNSQDSLWVAWIWRLSNVVGPAAQTPLANARKLLAILAALAGGSLIYVLGGGFSLDSRKKYPLVPLMLLLLCWIYRAACDRVRTSRRAFLAGSVCAFGAAR